jgi:tripartite-type tricarboxylate transporter receptor subunit TctC
MKYTKLLGTAAIVAIAGGAFLTPSIASAVDFKGKTITGIVAAKEGGGMDKIVRMFSPFFEKHLPGNPTVIVRNMPGGGTVRGNN